MKISVGVGGVHKDVHSQFVGVGGAWKRISGSWVGVGGAWKRWYAPITFYDVTSSDIAISPTNPVASIRWDSDGTIVTAGDINGTAGTWMAGGNPADFEVYFDQTSGDAVTGTLDTWLSLGTDRTLSLTRSSNGSSAAAGTYSIRTTTGAYTLGSGTWSLAAEREP